MKHYSLLTTNYPLKIGIVCYPSVGGSGIVATNLGNELAELGHKIHFISYEKPFHLNLKQKNIFFHQVGINEYTLFKYPDYTLPLAVKIVALTQKYKLDVIHVHYAVPHATAGILARQIALKQKIKLPRIITTLHGTDISLMAQDKNLLPVIKYSIEESCSVTAVSHALKNETQKILKTKKPIEVIYNFYKPKTPTVFRDALRQKLKIKKNELLAIHLSNLRPVKRIPDLLKILSLSPKNIKLLILAGGNFSEYKPLVKKFRLTKRVFVKEKIQDIENYIPASDFGLYTSEKESFGMGLLETMAFGRPVIASKVDGFTEVMKHGETGLLCEMGNVNAFVSAIAYFYSNQNKMKLLGEMAQKRAEEHFSAKKIVAQYLNYYKKTLNC